MIGECRLALAAAKTDQADIAAKVQALADAEFALAVERDVLDPVDPAVGAADVEQRRGLQPGEPLLEVGEVDVLERERAVVVHAPRDVGVVLPAQDRRSDGGLDQAHPETGCPDRHSGRARLGARLRRASLARCRRAQ